MKSLAAVALLVALAACQTDEVRRFEEPSAPSGMRYQVDSELARTLGWAELDADDAAVRERARDVLNAELAARALEASVQLDAHGGVALVLPEDAGDALREAVHAAVLRSGSRVSFLLVAEAEDLAAVGGDLEAQRRKLEAWRAAHPDAPLGSFSQVATGAGGPHASVRWAERRDAQDGRSSTELPLLVPAAEDHFAGADLAEISRVEDELDRPALGFEFSAERAEAFKRFTSEAVGRQMAIVVDGRLLSAPRIQGVLPGRGIITGQFTDAELQSLEAGVGAAGLPGVFVPLR